ncbi:acyl-CoA dehydrogenase family protein [Kurthia sp. YJT4]|uniref:acyl-CoA dehydrogenase family protein n=1 Tax=Kurthia sp. YJT4 TaxID=3049086 RepID=UPI002551260E|nr:acyl-CoA dehydrogenase family protein [Kurthia sp. YJT4]WIL38993.1 acyl-CoA dehydrogenase family protein [Kurthia sp. YJT4]
MAIQLTEEQAMLQKMVRNFAQTEVAAFVPNMEKDEFPTAVLTKMGKLGLMGMTTPEKYGGSDMDFISYILAIHELSKVSGTVGVILSVHTSVATNPILKFGTDTQIEKYVPKLASGEYLGSFCLTEPAAGSDAASIKTSAKKVEGGYELNGSKVFITNGGYADVYIVFAVTDSTQKTKGITAFIVERTMEGLVIGKNEEKMGLHGSSTVQLTFENLFVPEENILGQLGEGFTIAMANLNVGRIGIAAQALGIAEAALEAAIGYAKERQQFNQPIIKHQGIAFKLADMATSVEAAKQLVYSAAALYERGEDCKKEASMAKLFASKIAVEVATEAIQVYGGYGYSKEYPVERYFRDAKVTEIYEGTSEIQRLVISKEL